MSQPLITTTVHPGADPVVLIHGFCSSGRADWESTGLVAALESAGRGAVVVHLPGHPAGAALARGAARTHDVAQAVVDAATDAAGTAPFDVIAYSLGARLAWAVAATGRVRRLVLGGLSAVDPFAGLDADALTSVVSGEAAPADPLQGMFAGMLQTPGLDAPSVIALMEGLAAEPFDPAVGAPSVPTLFIAGTDDPMSQGVESLAAGVRGSRLVRVPGDHAAALASPEFRTAAVEFVAA